MSIPFKAAFTRDLLEPLHMELIGSAWNCSHCIPFTRDRFQRVPSALLNHEMFLKTKASAFLLILKTKTETLFNSIV